MGPVVPGEHIPGFGLGGLGQVGIQFEGRQAAGLPLGICQTDDLLRRDLGSEAQYLRKTIGNSGDELLGPDDVDNKNEDERWVEKTGAPVIGLAGQEQMVQEGHWYLLLPLLSKVRNGEVVVVKSRFSMNPDLILQNIIFGLALFTGFKYVLYLITSQFYHFNRNKYLRFSVNLSKDEIEKRIKITVIVPAWNEEVGILTSVKSLLKSTYKNLEIIVVNDGSIDETDKVVKNFMAHDLGSRLSPGKEFKYFAKKNGGKGSAINFGIGKSTGDVIVTMDADTMFDPDALYNVAKYFTHPELDAAVGNVKIANSRNLLNIIQQIEYIVGFYFKRTHSVFNSEYIIGGAFGAYRRNCFERYGLLDEDNKTEDIEYSTRLQANDCNIVYIEEAIAYTEGPDTLHGLRKQRLRWKKGRLDTFIKHRSLFFKKSRRGNKFLTHFLLPITLFYEFELIFEPVLTVYGIYYLYRTGNFYPLLAWVVFTGIIYFIAFTFGSKKNSKTAFFFVPSYFLLSYVLTFVEVIAMYKSMKLLFARQDVVWQRWNRKGIVG